MASHSQSSPFKFLELTPLQPSQPIISQPSTVVRDTETLMASPSQPATSTNSLELTCSAPTQPVGSPSPTMAKQTPTLPEKENTPKDTTNQVSRALRGPQYKIRKLGVRRRIPCNYYGRRFTPVFRTAKAARFFGVTMKKGEDEAGEATESDCEREEKESRERCPSPDVADELPSDVTQLELKRKSFNNQNLTWLVGANVVDSCQGCRCSCWT